MPSIERKSLDRLKAGDYLLENADVFARAGQPVDEKLIKLLAKHKVSVVPTFSMTYEDKRKIHLGELEHTDFLKDFLGKRQSQFDSLKFRLLEKIKSVYVPFDEDDSFFHAPGKKKQIYKGVLQKPFTESLYQPDIDAASYHLMSRDTIHYCVEILKNFYTILERMKPRIPENMRFSSVIPRWRFSSVRLFSCYENGNLTTLGNALAQKCVECALAFMVTMVNVNKKRILEQRPLSLDRFDPDKAGTTSMGIFQYPPGMIIDAALGILLHCIGAAYKPVHQEIAARRMLAQDTKSFHTSVNLVQKQIFIARNLLRNRTDISSIARMIVSLQKDYPDGSGFPPPNSCRFHHEFLRLFQIIDFYDETTNPVFHRTSYHRVDVLRYLIENSGPYNRISGYFNELMKFDRNLVNEFLSVIMPFEPLEKLYLFSKNNTAGPMLIGRALPIKAGYLPHISVLRDESRDRNYPFGSLIINVHESAVIQVQNGKVVKQGKFPWIKDLAILDRQSDSASINEFNDPYFGKIRALARNIKKG